MKPPLHLLTNNYVNSSMLLLSLITSIVTLVFLFEAYLAITDELNLPPIEQTVVAAQTATRYHLRATEINATAVAMGISTITHTPSVRTTQVAQVNLTVRAEAGQLSSPVPENEIVQAIESRIALIPTLTADPYAVAREIENLTSSSRRLSNSFWGTVGTVLGLWIVVVSVLWMFHESENIYKDIIRPLYRRIFKGKNTASHDANDNES